MNDDTIRIDVRPEVERFVAAVRGHFADLSEDEREELLGGLEADLSDLVADRGVGALGDPAAYAEELRSAAGFGPVVRARSRGNLLSRVVTFARETGEAAADFVRRPRVAPWWQVLVTMRPAWWLVRGWVAAVIISVAMPGWESWGLPWMPGVGDFLGWVIFLSCLVGSTLVGVGRLWPGAPQGAERGKAAAVVLVLANTFAVVMLPVAMGYLGTARSEYASQLSTTWVEPKFATNRGQALCNVSAYDAAGNPLSGVQLFDQDGRPLELGCYDRAAHYVPWALGDVPRWNVVPLAARDKVAWGARKREDVSGASFPIPDKATVPPVQHPLVPVVVEPPVEDPYPGDQPEEGQKAEGQKAEGEDSDDARESRKPRRNRSDRAN